MFATCQKCRHELGDMCAISLPEEGTEEVEETVRLPYSHYFHNPFILSWFHLTLTCPTL